MLAYNQLMRADGFDTNDKTTMSHMSAVLWICDEPEREVILREILEALSPGQRSRLNTPIAARQRVKAELESRHGGGRERPSAASPVTIYKRQIDEMTRKLAHAEERLAAAEIGAAPFDLRRDRVDDIVRVMTDPTVITEHKAKSIAKGILEAFAGGGRKAAKAKAEAAPAEEEPTAVDLATALTKGF